MKNLMILIAALTFTTLCQAKPVDGEIFYIAPTSAKLVHRNVTIEVPARGQGEVVLSGKNFKWSTADFRTFDDKGRSVFMAVFQTTFQKMKSTMVLRGTYIKALNTIKYFGDMYKQDGHVDADDELTGLEYSGGFSFNYDRTPAAPAKEDGSL